MKIFCIIQCTNLGGMEQSALLLLEEFQKLGHDTELLSLNEMGDIGELLKERHIPSSSLGYQGLWGFRSFFPLRRLLKTKQADCLIMIGHNLMAILALGSFCKGKRLLSIHFHHKGVKPDWVWRIIYRLAMFRFKYIIYPSHFIMNEAVEICPFLKTKKRAVSYAFPLPMSISENIRLVKKTHARAALGIPLRAMVIGNAGWLIPRKRWDIFLQVAARACEEIEDAQFIIAGDGPDLPQLKTLATSLGIEDRIHWLGWQKDLKRFYLSLDLMLFNSDWDAMGRTALEAMSCGIPVVASVLHGGLSEIIDSDACGYIIDSHDVPRLAAKVVEIIKNKTLAETMARQSRAKLEKVGSPKQHALRVLQMFQY